MTTADAAPAVTFRASYRTDTGAPTGWDLLHAYDTEAERDAVLAALPKSTGARATTWGSLVNGQHVTRPAVSARGNLVADGTNGGVNETGIRRYRSILRAAAKAGIEVRWDAYTACSNAYRTQAEFEAAIA